MINISFFLVKKNIDVKKKNKWIIQFKNPSLEIAILLGFISCRLRSSMLHKRIKTFDECQSELRNAGQGTAARRLKDLLNSRDKRICRLSIFPPLATRLGLFGRPDIPLVQPARDHYLHNFQNAPPLNYWGDEVIRPTVV